MSLIVVSYACTADTDESHARSLDVLRKWFAETPTGFAAGQVAMLSYLNLAGAQWLRPRQRKSTGTRESARTPAEPTPMPDAAPRGA